MCRGNNTNCLNAYYLHKRKYQTEPKQNAKQIDCILHHTEHSLERTHTLRAHMCGGRIANGGESKGEGEGARRTTTQKNVN